jgi:hypothetical protein
MPIQAKLLVAWMSREEAVIWLTNEAVPPLTLAQAIQTWEQYQANLNGLPAEQLCTALPLSNAEHQTRRMVLASVSHRKDVVDVVKLDLMSMPIRQMRVIVPRYEAYQSKVKTRNGWIAEALSTTVPNVDLKWQYSQNGSTTEALFELPHGEFMLPFDPQIGGFRLRHGDRTVEVATNGMRYALWAGYHRSLARLVSNIGDGNERSALLTVTTSPFLTTPSQSPDDDAKRSLCLLERPPLLKDFLNDSLCMTLNLKKQRFLYRVKGYLEATEDNT